MHSYTEFIDQFGFKNVISLRPPYLGVSKSIIKEEYFKLHVCTALVQKQVYAWVIASSFVLLEAPQVWRTPHSWNWIGL